MSSEAIAQPRSMLLLSSSFASLKFSRNTLLLVLIFLVFNSSPLVTSLTSTTTVAVTSQQQHSSAHQQRSDRKPSLSTPQSIHITTLAPASSFSARTGLASNSNSQALDGIDSINNATTTESARNVLIGGVKNNETAQSTATSTHRAPYKYPLARYLRTLDESRRRHHHLRMSTVSKSYHTKDPIITYISNVSLRLDPLQVELQQNTIEHAPMSGMLGAPEVLQFGRNLIHLTQAKRVLDIGTYTGASAFAWALAVPPDGEVLSMDISHENLNKFGKEIIARKPEIMKKINFKLGPALETLDSLLNAAQNGTWDFAFIDADKLNYPNYYQKCIELLRPGGVLMIDNALWGGSVVFDDKDEQTKAIDKTNHMIASDDRVDNMLLNLGDGTHVIFKKHQ